jgi:hypothetical protein
VSAPDVYTQIQTVLSDADDPDRLRHSVLARLGSLGEAQWRPGDAPPDDSLDGRWRRALAVNPSAVLGALQRAHPPASVRQFGNGREWEITLGDGAGRLIVRYIPNG